MPLNDENSSKKIEWKPYFIIRSVVGISFSLHLMGRGRWEVSRSNTCITAQIVFQWALGSLMFWKLIDDFFKICACQDKLEDKVNPRCLWTVTSSIILLFKINWGFWGWNGLSLFVLKNNWFSLRFIHSHQPPFSQIRYWFQVMIKFRRAITRRRNFFQQKTIVNK